jgi:large subunit ribosomal protein L18
MATGPKYNVKFRREREGKTNYKKRLALVKSMIPKFVVRISNKNVICQVIEYHAHGDKVLASGSSQELSKLGWTGAGANIPAAYLVGYLCAKKAVKSKPKKAVLDTGFMELVAGTTPFAALKGALDGGLEIPHSESILPSKERLDGAHIGENLKIMVEKTKKNIDSKF